MTNPTVPIAVRAAFSAEHGELDRLFSQLSAAFAAEVPTEHARLWSALDERLRAHMDLEERELLPRLASAHPDEAAAIRHEHDELRRRLLALGVGVDLHTTRAEAVDEFLDLMRRHARREDALFYRWADETLGARERSALIERARADAHGPPARPGARA